MKPRTKLQFRVSGLSQQLPDISDMMISWAKKDCLERKGYATKSRVICMECGQRFSPESVKRKRAVCPHCGASLKVEASMKRTDKQSMYIAKAEICEEFQVIRSFELYAYYREGKEPHYFLLEILQHWIKDDGSREVVARAMNMGGNGWCGELEIRKKSVGSYYCYGLNDVYCDKYHPASVFRPKYKQFGIDYKLYGISFLKAIEVLPYNPKIETLIKSRYYEILSYFDGNSSEISKYWASIKICLRNKYRIKDGSMWFDYLHLLERYHKDLHNAFYVCPRNLKKAHDYYVAKRRKEQEKEAQEREKQALLKQKKAEEEFMSRISKFVDLMITDKKLVITPLKSLEEFKREGDIMHHCVFTNGYWKRASCLILSARIGDSHIETIEINLNTFKVVQSRAVCNGVSKYHNEILKLVNKNMNLIRKRLTA